MATTKSTASKKDVKKTVVKTPAPKKTQVVTATRVRIIVRSFDYTVIDEAAKSIVETAERGGSLVSGPVPLPTKIKRYTVNRSFFVHKDARDQYEIRTHKRLIDIKEPTTQTIESLQNLTLPAGVDVEIKMM
ncbi:30S ribosomal protein S10 [Candidatus Gracilibacteria bacterium]|nr:30S ribosomal protein S10 [Candidatus Gracilibacteria bacterium]